MMNLLLAEDLTQDINIKRHNKRFSRIGKLRLVMIKNFSIQNDC